VPLTERFPRWGEPERDFLAQCLAYDPDERSSCAELLESEYFGTNIETFERNLRDGLDKDADEFAMKPRAHRQHRDGGGESKMRYGDRESKDSRATRRERRRERGRDRHHPEEKRGDIDDGRYRVRDRDKDRRRLKSRDGVRRRGAGRSDPHVGASISEEEEKDTEVDDEERDTFPLEPPPSSHQAPRMVALPTLAAGGCGWV
jgi:hypothetical protein